MAARKTKADKLDALLAAEEKIIKDKLPARPKAKAGPPAKGRPDRNGRKQRDIRVAGRSLEALEHPELIAEWDDEELARGYRRAPDGTFRGRPPNIIPRECHIELQRRYRDKAASFFAEHAEEMAEVLWKIAMNPEQDGRARVAAANSMLDRAIGKPDSKQTVDVTVHEPKFVAALQGAIVSIESDGTVIDTTAREESAA